MTLDALIIAAHPDDAEICVGGTILRWARAGKRVGVIDLTRGEMGTRGTREDRDNEAAEASERLGLAHRENLNLPDGRVEVTVENREALAARIRELAPHVVLAHHDEDLHPDHAAAGKLSREAWYLSGLKRLAEGSGAPAHRPARLLHFIGHVPFEPTFVMDIGPVWEDKVHAVKAYETQIVPASGDDTGSHFLFGADILQRMETQARYWGERIGKQHGEALQHRGPVPLGDPLLTWLG